MITTLLKPAEGRVTVFGTDTLTAYILCAFGFAVMAGLLLRRSIPAMVAAFVPWLAIRLVVEFLFRPHFLAPLTATAKCTLGCGEGIGFVPQATGRTATWC
jgi:hypothetical protein